MLAVAILLLTMQEKLVLQIFFKGNSSLEML